MLRRIFSKVQKEPSRGDALWPWYLATAFYVGLGALVLYGRWAEVESLFTPPKSPPDRLPLNSIGDVLAGFFAPLAFLWLFVATQLQRKELALQRKELENTRAVLDEQRNELQRAAAESNLQTAIMQETLKYAKEREDYEFFSLKLYFCCRRLNLYKNSRVRFPLGEIKLFSVEPEVYISQSDTSTVDLFLENLKASLELGARSLSMANSIDNPMIKNNSTYFETVSFLNETIDMMKKILLENEITGNTAINLRLSSLPINKIIEHCSGIRSIIN
ncbi:hypothetical protein [Methylobacterium sp. CM6247]